jgi:hypothetical protein
VNYGWNWLYLFLFPVLASGDGRMNDYSQFAPTGTPFSFHAPD